MQKNINTFLSAFPKTRQELSIELKEIYQKIYMDNREGKGIGNKISQLSEIWCHKIIEKRFKYGAKSNCLEIGAGNLNHIPYLINKEEAYDIVEPEQWFYKGSSNINRINKIYDSIYDVKSMQNYNRIISIMVLEHVLDLPNLIEKCLELLEVGGLFQAAIPCEGELAWYLAWRFGTSSFFWLKYRKDWGKMIRYEHVNNLREITALIEHYFGNIKVTRSPAPFLIQKKHFSFYAYIEAVKK